MEAALAPSTASLGLAEMHCSKEATRGQRDAPAGMHNMHVSGNGREEEGLDGDSM